MGKQKWKRQEAGWYTSEAGWFCRRENSWWWVYSSRVAGFAAGPFGTLAQAKDAVMESESSNEQA